MKTSLVVITKNRPQELKRCLQSVLAQNKLPQEIVIVYYHKQDLSLIKNLKTKLITVRSVKANTSEARNLGLRKAKGDIVIFLDDDCVVTKNWFNNIVRFFNLNPQAKVVMGKNLHPAKENFISSIENQRVNNLVKKHLFKHRRQSASLFLDSKNFAVRRLFLINNQLWFDTRFKNAYVDVDLGWQIWSLKVPIYYDPSIVVYHYGRSSLVRHFFRELKYGYNYQLLKKKWFNYAHRYLLSRLAIANFNQQHLFCSQSWVLDLVDNGLRNFGGLLAKVLNKN